MHILISHPYEVNPYYEATVSYGDNTSKLLVLGEDRKTGDLLVFSHGDTEDEDLELYRGYDYQKAQAAYDAALTMAAEDDVRITRSRRDQQPLTELVARKIQSSRTFNETHALRAQRKADRIKGRVSYHLNAYIFGL